MMGKVVSNENIYVRGDVRKGSDVKTSRRQEVTSLPKLNVGSMAPYRTDMIFFLLINNNHKKIEFILIRLEKADARFGLSANNVKKTD
jgi:hypothetical protein